MHYQQENYIDWAAAAEEGNPESCKETSPGFARQARRVFQKESEEDHRDAEEERKVRSEEAADP